MNLTFIVALHIAATAGLAIYALHELMLLLLALRRVAPVAARPMADAALPTVCVQLPIYNEGAIAARVIAAASALDYPADKLRLQVLDDSDDGATSLIAQQSCGASRSRGLCVDYVVRPDRSGYKAGALQHGLPRASSDFLAIFDADFVPAPDFLRAVFARRPFDDPRVCFAQARWDFLNRDVSAITRGQALMLDMHFMIEQPARSNNGLMLNFNGTGGVWRRSCVEALGWEGDTLAEDLDLSYRAELAGWRGVYLADIGAPGDLLPQFAAFMQQQARWSRASAQNVRKLMPRILQSTKPAWIKAAALLHITGYLLNAFLLILTLTLPWVGGRADLLPAWFGSFSLLGMLPVAVMAVAHARRARSLPMLIRDFPMAVVFGIGFAASDVDAWLRGFFSKRTGSWRPSPKGGARSNRRMPWMEAGLAVYCAAGMFALAVQGQGLAAITVGLYALCYTVVVGFCIVD